MFVKLLLIFVGSGSGGAMRFLLSRFVSNQIEIKFPVGTLVVNVLACFLVGAFTGYFTSRNQSDSQLMLLFTTGFCGGFSTLSTLTNESLMLTSTGQYGAFMLNIGLSILLGLAANYLGLWIMTHK